MKRTFVKELLMITMSMTILTSIGVIGFCETEPNNTIGSANTVELNSSDEGALSAEDPTDVHDFYKVVLPQDGFFQVGVVPTPELDVSVTLFDSNGIAVLGSKDENRKGSSEGVLYPNIRAGTYYSLVNLISGNGTYSITQNYAPVEEIDAEPNDTLDQANALDVDGSLEGHIGYHGNMFTDIHDFYFVNVPSDGVLELTVFPENTLRVGLQLRDSNGVFVMNSQDTNNKGGSEKITYSSIAAGSYYVLVYRSDAYGSYTLTSKFTSNPDLNDNEPNDKYSQASQQIVLTENADGNFGGSVNGHMGYFGQGQRDEIDHFKITLPSFGRLILSIEAGVGNNVNLGFGLYNSNNRYVGGNDTHNIPAGEYTILAVRSNTSYGAYTLNAEFVPKDPTPPFSGEASAIAPNDEVRDVALSADVVNKYYKVNLPQHGRLIIRGFYSDSLRAGITLYHADGQSAIASKESWYQTGEITIDKPDLRQGEYIIRMYHNGGEGLGRIVTEFTPVEKIDEEPNDVWSEFAHPISLTDTVVGNLGYSGNGFMDVVDHYQFEIEYPGALTITASSETSHRYRLTLYAIQGKAYQGLEGKEGWFTEAPIAVGKVNVLAGRYFIAINHISGYGQYEFNIDFEPNRSSDPEVNNNPFNPTVIDLSDGMAGHIGYESGHHGNDFIRDNLDWFKFELPEDGRLILTTHGNQPLRMHYSLYYNDFNTRIAHKELWYTNSIDTIGHDSLRAGTYYIRLERYGGYGMYHFYMHFEPQSIKDEEPNNFISTATTKSLGEVIQGSLYYNNQNTSDVIDWYKIDVPAEAKYKFSYQGEKSLRVRFQLFAPNQVTVLQNRDKWYADAIDSLEVDLSAGTYYIAVSREGGYGRYAVQLGNLDAIATGTLKGKVSTQSNFPLAQVNVELVGSNWSDESDFSGNYSFSDLMPGKYKITFKAGSKYYDAVREVEIVAGQETLLDVQLPQSNDTAPTDVERLYGFAADRYLHLFWTPSVSFDVADGGGYKLYLNDQEPIDLGNVLRFYDDGFVNGVEYNCRLTVYDKFGNESDGKSITLMPEGTIVEPTPTPTPRPVGQPTPTPTATPTPFEQPTPVICPTQKPCPTCPAWPTCPQDPVVGEVEPIRVYEFDLNTLDDNGWAEQPGGFTPGTPAGFVLPIIFTSDPIPTSLDNKGLAIKVRSGDVAMIFASEPVQTNGHPVLFRMNVSADAANAAVWIAGLKGALSSFQEVDGSIGYTNPQNCGAFLNQERRLTLVYQPGGSQLITPIIQVAGLDGGQVTVYVDRFEIFILEPGRAYPGDLFATMLD